MFREDSRKKMETRSSCQQILLIAKFPDLRTTNILPARWKCKKHKNVKSVLSVSSVLAGLRILEFEFSQFMRLFLISNLSLLWLGSEGEIFFYLKLVCPHSRPVRQIDLAIFYSVRPTQQLTAHTDCSDLDRRSGWNVFIVECQCQ